MSPRKRLPIPLTTIGRPLDLRTSSNLAIVVIFFAALVGATVAFGLLGASWSIAARKGLSLAGAVFFAWAVARETDPDRPTSAFLAACGACAGAALLGGPHFLLLFWFLLALRTINRSTGVPPGALDWVGLYGIKLWLGYSAHWAIPMLSSPTLLFAGLQRLPKGLRIALPLALPAATIGYGFAHRWRFELPQWPGVEAIVLAAVALATIPVIVSYRKVRSVGDRTGAPLVPHRVQWGLGWAVVAAAILTLSGTATLADLAPIWSALAGTSLGWAIGAALRGVRAQRK